MAAEVLSSRFSFEVLPLTRQPRACPDNISMVCQANLLGKLSQKKSPGREGEKTLRGDRRTAVTVAAEDITLAVATARRALGLVMATISVVTVRIISEFAGHSMAAVSRDEGCEAELNQDQRRELHFCGLGCSV